MDNRDKQQQFQNALTYRKIGFFVWFIAIIPMTIIQGTLKYIVTVIICAIAIYFERKYKCPYCGKVFNPRIKPRELTYCPECSKKLQ